MSEISNESLRKVCAEELELTAHETVALAKEFSESGLYGIPQEQRQKFIDKAKTAPGDRKLLFDNYMIEIGGKIRSLNEPDAMGALDILAKALASRFGPQAVCKHLMTLAERI